MRDKEMQ